MQSECAASNCGLIHESLQLKPRQKTAGEDLQRHLAKELEKSGSVFGDQ